MQDYSIHTSQPMPIEAEQLGPRAKFLVENSIATKIEIQKNITLSVFKYFMETIAVSPNAPEQTFSERHITVEGQESIKNLDQRTSILFQNIIHDVVTDNFQCLQQISNFCGNDVTRGMYIKEAALPFILKLVQKIDEFDKDLLNEATSDGVDPTYAQKLQALGIF